MRRQINIELNKTAILLFILSMLEPQYIINFIMPVHYLFRMAYYLSFVIMFIGYFGKSIEWDQIPIFSCMGLYFVCRALSTWLYGGLFSASISKMLLSQFIMCLGVLYIARELKNCGLFIIKCIMVWGELILYINFISILIFPHGIWQSAATGNACFFLGHKNQIFDYMFLPIVCSLIYHYIERDKSIVRLWALYSVSLISAVLSSSKGAFMAVVFFIPPVLLLSFKKYNFKMPILWAVAMPLLLNAGMVFLGIQSVFSSFLDTSFTGRTAIWKSVLNFLSQRRFWGWGENFSNFNGLSFLKGLKNTHNGILGLLVYGGYIGLAVWIITNVVVVKKVKIYSENFLSTIFAFIFLAFYIHGIVETSYGGLNMYLLFALAINIESLIDIDINSNKESPTEYYV